MKIPIWLGVPLLLAAPLAAEEASLPGPQEDPVDLRLQDLAGKGRSLTEFSGQIVVLNFWATWCAPCREEMPLLASVQQHYAASGVQVIGASVDDPSTRNSVLEFARRFKLNFPVWLGATLADMQRIGLGGALPATAILDRDGRVAARLIGMAHRASLTTRIDWLLSDRRTPSFPSLVNTIEKDPHAAGHEHGGEEHDHAVIALEGASTVPS